MTGKFNYSYRPNLFQPQQTIVSGREGLERRDKTGRILRQIAWADVVQMQQFQYAMARTEDGGRVPLLAFSVKPQRGRRIMFLSGTWTGPGAGNTPFADCSDAFLPLVRDIKRRVADVNPRAELITGDRGYSFLLKGLTGLIAVIAVVVGIAFLSTSQMDREGGRILLLLAGLVLFVAPLVWRAARAYKPVSTTVSADLSEDRLAG